MLHGMNKQLETLRRRKEQGDGAADLLANALDRVENSNRDFKAEEAILALCLSLVRTQLHLVQANLDETNANIKQLEEQIALLTSPIQRLRPNLT